MGKKIGNISKKRTEIIQKHNWPGNIAAVIFIGWFLKFLLLPFKSPFIDCWLDLVPEPDSTKYNFRLKFSAQHQKSKLFEFIVFITGLVTQIQIGSG